MKLLSATKNAFGAFRSSLKSYSGYDLWDYVTNGWARVSNLFGSFWSSLRDWGGTDYKALAESAAANPHAGRAMRLIIDNGSSVVLGAYKEKEEVPSDALEVVQKTGWDKLWAAFTWGIYCGGEVFLRKIGPTTGRNAGKARELVILRNEDFLEIKRDSNGEPTKYIFKNRSEKADAYEADEILHIKNFNPLDPDRGLPLLLSARRALTLVEEADTWNRSIAKGGGRVPGYWMPLGLDGKQLSVEQQEDAQKAFDKVSQKNRKRNSETVLSGAFERIQGDVTPKDADWLKGREVSQREIASVTGVPVTLLADSKAGSLTDAGVDSEVAALFKLTIVPKVDWFLMELTAWLCDGEELKADWDQVKALQEDIDAMYLRYTLASGEKPLTRKEARVALGYDPEPEKGMEDDVDDSTLNDLENMEDEEFKSVLRLVV